jgi:hypothetical protein
MIKLVEIGSGLTRGQARAIEQALIRRNGGVESAANLNIYNSISPKRDIYNQAREWGEAWLRANGI